MGKESQLVFAFYLAPTTSESPSDVEDHIPPDLSDIGSVLQAVCRCLKGRGKFVVTGFDAADWPVDVKTDLSVFLEQAPALLQFATNYSKRPFILSFYEQGIERDLIFTWEGDLIVVSCKPWTRWKPIIDQITVTSKDLREMLSVLVANLVDAANKYCPNLSETIEFRQWLGSMSR
jgi:hypothetical protein